MTYTHAIHDHDPAAIHAYFRRRDALWQPDGPHADWTAKERDAVDAALVRAIRRIEIENRTP